MEIALGSLSMLVVCLLYDKLRKPKKVIDVISIDQKKKEKELADHFEGLFNYTPEQAYRKVKNG